MWSHRRRGVPGIVAALEADHDVGLGGQPIDDLALALVAPLGPDNNYIRHELLVLAGRARRFVPRRMPARSGLCYWDKG
jgi:hypothetical protein